MKVTERLKVLLWELFYNVPLYVCYNIVLENVFTESQALVLTLILYFKESLNNARIEELQQIVKKQ